MSQDNRATFLLEIMLRTEVNSLMVYWVTQNQMKQNQLQMFHTFLCASCCWCLADRFRKYISADNVVWKTIRSGVGKGTCPLYKDKKITFMVNLIVLLFPVFPNRCGLLVRKEKKVSNP